MQNRDPQADVCSLTKSTVSTPPIISIGVLHSPYSLLKAMLQTKNTLLRALFSIDEYTVTKPLL